MAWEISDHVCATCLGRVLVSEDGDRSRCSNCGTEIEGEPKAICCCGIRLKSRRNAGIRCVKNPEPSPAMPSEIVAEQVS